MKLRDKDKLAILQIAKKTIKTKADILAYGSRVSGDAHDLSDLDLVIKTEDNQPLAIDELMNFKQQLRQSNIPILIEVLDWGRIPNSFKKNIQQQYELLN